MGKSMSKLTSKSMTARMSMSVTMSRSMSIIMNMSKDCCRHLLAANARNTAVAVIVLSLQTLDKFSTAVIWHRGRCVRPYHGLSYRQVCMCVCVPWLLMLGGAVMTMRARK
jgi:hypothetical protein